MNKVQKRLPPKGSLSLALVVATGLAASAAGAMAMPKPEALSNKEAFMLMFGKGNGAMRTLCALQKHGLIDGATRRQWVEQLETLLSEPGDSALDRRNARLGMTFADARSSLCPERIMGRSNP